MNRQTPEYDALDYDRNELKRLYNTQCVFAHDVTALTAEKDALDESYRAVILIDYHRHFSKLPGEALKASPHYGQIDRARCRAYEAVALGLMRRLVEAPPSPEIVAYALEHPDRLGECVEAYRNLLEDPAYVRHASRTSPAENNRN